MLHFTDSIFLETEKVDRAIVVRFTGAKVALNEETAPGLGEQLACLVERLNVDTLLVDFGNVWYLSSVALGALVKQHRQLQPRGGRLVLCNLAPELYEVFAVTRLNTVIDIRQDGPDGETSSAASHPGSVAGVPMSLPKAIGRG